MRGPRADRTTPEQWVESPDPERVRAVHRALRRAYGRPQPQQRRDPLDGLIATLLSQSTTGANARAAFAELKRRFPEWDECLAASGAEVVEAVRSAGLGQTRGPRIQAILARVLADTGELSLEGLHRRASRDAMAYLLTLPGVGPKTAACVLLFSCARQVFPVDTHVARIARRLGWAPASASPEAIQAQLEPVIPGPLRYPLHVNLIAHGRAVCRASRPACERCVLREWCQWARSGTTRWAPGGERRGRAG